jgi:photosystem II stability/assembly factor-like uncharacterized protein
MLRQCIALLFLSLSAAASGAGAGNATSATLGLNAHGRGGWQSVGPAPPAIEATIVSDPASRTIYIGSLGGGVLKSTDGGSTFTVLADGPPGVTAMVMEPNNPEVVYASTGGDNFKTIDGGATWYSTGGAGVSLAMDPADPNVLYAGLSPIGGVLKTTDGGVTWLPVTEGMGEPAVFSIVVDPIDHNVVYAGTAGSGAFKSIDGAATWTPLNVDSTVWSMLIDPTNSNIVYAGSNGNGVYKSTNAGGSFARVGSPEVGVILALAKIGHQLYAGTATQGVSVSNDGGRSWKNTGVSSGLGLSLSVNSAGAVFVGTNFDGAFVRPPNGDDGADNFQDTGWRRLGWTHLQHCACQNGHAIAVDPSARGHVFFGTNDGGLLVTEDGGRTWKDGGTNGFVARSPRGIAFDPQQPQRVYAAAFTGGGFFKSEDHGMHWKRRAFGSSLISLTGVAVDPTDHSVYVGSIRTREGVWKSIDYGDTFKRVDRSPGAPPGQYLGLSGRGVTVDPHRHRTVYFADNSGARGIWRSQDAGGSWVRVDETPTLSVTVDPTDSNMVFAATSDGRVLKSIDGGTSFIEKSNGLAADAPTSRTGSVQVDPNHPYVLYVGIEGDGVFKSTDAAESWFPVNLGLDDTGIVGLALDPESPDTLYVSTGNSSVFKTVTGGR